MSLPTLTPPASCSGTIEPSPEYGGTGTNRLREAYHHAQQQGGSGGSGGGAGGAGLEQEEC